MSYQAIGLGTAEGDGTGDTLRIGGDKVNDNFVEIYTLLGTGSALSSGISATASVVTLAGPSITGVASFADGSVSAPSITNTGDTNTGIFFSAADKVNVTTGGTERIEIDSSGLAVTGNVTATGTVEPAGDTAAGDNAAIGYTSAEGLILTGQGSTNDVTIKNDADADVIEIPTGTTNVAFAGNIAIANAGNIGSASDADAIAIASDGVVTFSQAPVFPDGSINIADIDLDGGTDIGAALADADLLLVDDGGGGTMRKMAAARLKTYIQASTSATAANDIAAGDDAVNITTTSGNITIDAAANNSAIILKGTEGGVDTTFLTIDGSVGGEATFNAGIVIADAGTIGSASDKDAIAIASDGVVTFSQIPVLPANSIDSDQYVDGSIDTDHIAADAVTGAKIADDAINSEHYTDGSIDTAHVADSQITLAKTSAVGEIVAWVNFNGDGTVSINANGNVSSITDNGVGNYTVNFTSNISDGNYAVSGTANRNNGSNKDLYLSPASTNVGDVTVFGNDQGGNLRDMVEVCVVIVR